MDALVRCHEEHPLAKFLNACGNPKLALDLCFKEEKKLRRKLNQKVATTLPPGLVMNRPIKSGAELAAEAGRVKGTE